MCNHELNQFYGCFDQDGSHDNPTHDQLCMDLVSSLNDDKMLQLSITAVEKSFKAIKSNKSAGPDEISERILKSCDKELAGVFLQLF